MHPRMRNTLAFVPAQFNERSDAQGRELIEICKQEKGRAQDPGLFGSHRHARHHVAPEGLLEQEGFKVAVLRASADAARREDWIAEQLDRGIDVPSPIPSWSKPAWTCWSFPTIVFLQSGYNVYSLQQAARRSGASARNSR